MSGGFRRSSRTRCRASHACSMGFALRSSPSTQMRDVPCASRRGGSDCAPTSRSVLARVLLRLLYLVASLRVVPPLPKFPTRRYEHAADEDHRNIDDGAPCRVLPCRDAIRQAKEELHPDKEQDRAHHPTDELQQRYHASLSVFTAGALAGVNPKTRIVSAVRLRSEPGRDTNPRIKLRAPPALMSVPLKTLTMQSPGRVRRRRQTASRTSGPCARPRPPSSRGMPRSRPRACRAG
jgi:hypothetical protein